MKRTIACVIGIVLLCQSTLLAELRVANIFNDNMVLQQEKPIRVWGWADSGKTVNVTLTEEAIGMPRGTSPSRICLSGWTGSSAIPRRSTTVAASPIGSPRRCTSI